MDKATVEAFDFDVRFARYCTEGTPKLPSGKLLQFGERVIGNSLLQTISRKFFVILEDYSKKLCDNERCFLSVHAENLKVVVANNLGIIHLRLHRYSVALRFFQHAWYYELKLDQKVEKSSVLHKRVKRKSDILYNMGIAMLYLSRPKEAFECLLIALKVQNYNTRLWFRLAEACIMFNDQAKRNSSNEQPFAIPSPTYEFALLCLRNADVLNGRYQRKGRHEITGLISSFANKTAKESENLTSAFYAASCYVSIRLQEYSLALEYGMMLRKEKGLSALNLYLANLYCAESLVLLNKLGEAHYCLDLQMCQKLEPRKTGWIVKSSEAAQSVVYYNLVLVLILQEKVGAAYTLLTNCSLTEMFSKFNVFKQYIENVFETRDNRNFFMKKRHDSTQ